MWRNNNRQENEADSGKKMKWKEKKKFCLAAGKNIWQQQPSGLIDQISSAGQSMEDHTERKV